MGYDLSFVAPDRRDEVLRRITVIESFLKDRGKRAAEAHARQLGLGTAQFYNLVRAWENGRRPDRLTGAGHRRERGLEVNREQAAHMDAIIAADPRAAPADIIQAIIEAGGATGLKLPRREIVARYVARARPPLLPNEMKDCGLLIDHSVLEVPILCGTIVTRPLVTLVIDTSIDAAVGLALSLGYPSPGTTAAAVLDALRSSLRHSAEPAKLAVRVPRSSGENKRWSRLDSILRDAGFAIDADDVSPRGHGTAIEALLGRRPSRIDLRAPPGVGATRHRTIKAYSALQPMSMKVALDYVRPMLIGSRTTAAFAHLDDLTRIQLDEQLAQLAGC